MIYSYCRFTELEMVQDGISLDELREQEQLAVQTCCLRQQWFLDESFQDVEASWNLEFAHRANAARLLQQVKAGDVVVTSNLERMFSSCQDAVSNLEILKLKGVGLHVAQLEADVTDPACMVNFGRVAQLFAGLERRRSAERIKGLKRKQRSKGRYLGGSRPFGYMIHDNGRLIENPMEQRVLKRIFQLKKQGKSLRAISKEVSTPVCPVSFKTVQRLLQRHANLL